MTGALAPTRNVTLFASLAERICDMNPELPGIGIFYGPSGYGKTRSAEYAAHLRRAYYLEVGESWTKRHFLRRLSTEVGVPDRGTIPELVERLIEALSRDPRLLIIDEFDHVVARGYHECVREIHDKAQSPVVCIGEELLPTRIDAASERFHNRVLEWVQAQPSDADDFGLLRRHYCPEVELADDLVAALLSVTAGRTRRLAVNLDRIREHAMLHDTPRLALADLPRDFLQSGKAPAQRVVA